HRVEVHRSHAVEKAGELVDALARLRIGRRPQVVVADDARELEASELVADAADEMLHRELALAQRHFVLREGGAGLVESRAQILERGFALGEIRAERIEYGAGLRERLVG